jgi:diadenosine tetraphosphate (Ap4A) HIT family hydrolase
MDCPLCHVSPAAILFEDAHCMVIRVDDPAYPGYCRVIWRAHVAEMSDLQPDERSHLLAVVNATEQALRALMQPDKINLASLGNMVPHLHWHVIPRFRDDRHFPESVWGVPQRAGVARTAPSPQRLADTIRAALG